jgi:hypothetical protein
MSKWSGSDDTEFWRRFLIGEQHPDFDGPLDGFAVTSRADTRTLENDDA